MVYYETCTKYEFGITFAEILNFSKRLIIKGKLQDTRFGEIRANNLSLNINKLKSYRILTPTINDSIEQYMFDKLDHNLKFNI